MLITPGFSAAAVAAPIVGFLAAASARSCGLSRIAWLTALVALAAPIELALMSALSISGSVLLGLWGALLLVAGGMLVSYIREHRRGDRQRDATSRMG